MMNADPTSNAQTWELEVACKNRKYLNEVIKAILEDGFIEFEVNLVDILHSHEESMDARYTVLMWCSCFNRLGHISTKLAEIEEKLEQ